MENENEVREMYDLLNEMRESSKEFDTEKCQKLNRIFSKIYHNIYPLTLEGDDTIDMKLDRARNNFLMGSSEEMESLFDDGIRTFLNDGTNYLNDVADMYGISPSINRE